MGRYSGGSVNVQRGSYSFLQSGGATQTVTIAAVSMDKALLVVSHDAGADGGYAPACQITSPTQLTFKRDITGSGSERSTLIEWQVIEYLG